MTAVILLIVGIKIRKTLPVINCRKSGRVNSGELNTAIMAPFIRNMIWSHFSLMSTDLVKYNSQLKDAGITELSGGLMMSCIGNYDSERVGKLLVVIFD